MGLPMLNVLLRYRRLLIGAALALAVVAGVLLYGSSKYGCLWTRTIYVSQADVLADGTARQVPSA